MIVLSIGYDNQSKPVSVTYTDGMSISTVGIDMAKRMAQQGQFDNVDLIKNSYLRTKKGFKQVTRRVSDGSEFQDNKEIIGGYTERKAQGEREVYGRGCENGSRFNPRNQGVGQSHDNRREGSSGRSRGRQGESGRSPVGTACAILNVETATVISSDKFKRCFTKEKNTLDKVVGLFVDTHSWRSLDKCTCLSFDNNKAFIAVSDDGNIMSILKSARCNMRNYVRHALAQAIIHGGVKLDCYGVSLARLYTLNGFVPVCKIDFNEKFASKEWDVRVLGRPDIYFFMYIGDDIDTYVKTTRTDLYPSFSSYKYIPNVNEFPEWREKSGCQNDYDFAVLIRDTLLDKWINKYKNAYKYNPWDFVQDMLKGVK